MAYVKYTVFPEKVILKWNKDLVELHKRVIITYLVSQGLDYKTRKMFFKLYDMYINERNINCYFYTPTPILVQSIVLDRVNQVSTYIIKPQKTNGKSRSHKRKVSV